MPPFVATVGNFFLARRSFRLHSLLVARWAHGGEQYFFLCRVDCGKILWHSGHTGGGQPFHSSSQSIHFIASHRVDSEKLGLISKPFRPFVSTRIHPTGAWTYASTQKAKAFCARLISVEAAQVTESPIYPNECCRNA